jgi:hypothetical protein
MGIGIAQVASQIAKLNVVLMDVKQEILNKSLQFMGTSEKLVFLFHHHHHHHHSSHFDLSKF